MKTVELLLGGILTLNDFSNYAVRVREPIKGSIGDNLTLLGLGLPSGNVVLHRALNILEGLHSV